MKLKRHVFIIAAYAMICMIIILCCCALYLWIENISSVIRHNTIALIISLVASFAVITMPIAIRRDCIGCEKSDKNSESFCIGYITKKTSALSNVFNLLDLVLLFSLVLVYTLTTFLLPHVNLFCIICSVVLFISNFSIQTYFSEFQKDVSKRQSLCIMGFISMIAVGCSVFLWISLFEILTWWVSLVGMILLIIITVASYVISKKKLEYFNK